MQTKPMNRVHLGTTNGRNSRRRRRRVCVIYHFETLKLSNNVPIRKGENSFLINVLFISNFQNRQMFGCGILGMC